MKKNIVIGFIAVFVFFELASYLIHGVLLGPAWASVKSVRPDMARLMWVYHVTTLVSAFFFTFIFSKGYEGKGMGEGIRYGTYIGLWLGIPMAYGTYGMFDIGYSLTVQWFLYAVVQYIIGGIILGLIFKPKSAQPAKA